MGAVEANGYTIEPGANIFGAHLTKASLVGASLVGAVLTGAVLTGAVLTGAVLTGAVLTGAFAGETTLWPKGFDPVAAGMNFELLPWDGTP